MNITPWTIYWITRLDAVWVVLIVPMVMVGVATVILGIGALVCATDANEPELAKVLGKWGLVTCASALLLGVALALIPSTKEAVAMIVVPRILANEQVQKLPDNFLNLANEWMEELRPGKEKSE